MASGEQQPPSRLLVCIDGSIYQPSVLDHAAWASRRLGIGIQVLHALDHHSRPSALGDLSGNLGLDERDELLADLVALDEQKGKLSQKRGKMILEQARRHLGDAGIEPLALTQRHATLRELIEEHGRDAAMVVIGKRGEAADFDAPHLGSNLERVVRASHQPVLIAARAFKPIRKVVIAWDGGRSVTKALDFLLTSPLLKGLDIELFHIGKPERAKQVGLEEARQRLENAGFVAHATSREGEPESVLAQHVKDGGADLLVMGAYGHSRIRQLIVGSTTTIMIRTCKIPVLVFR